MWVLGRFDSQPYQGSKPGSTLTSLMPTASHFTSLGLRATCNLPDFHLLDQLIQEETQSHKRAGKPGT